jgi:GrpB-like predicted nucleotidyltransferase (UPF0157 family)
VTIAEADPDWAVQGTAICDELIGIKGKPFLEVEHVGSTSVPGLPAKPVIDVMASAVSLGYAAGANDELAGLGYHLIETGMPARLFYRRLDPDGFTVHLHVVSAQSWPTRNERLLRDHLRACPADRDRYAALKRRLMERHGPGDAYTRGKTGLIQELTDRARAARGLPSVPVWEE